MAKHARLLGTRVWVMSLGLGLGLGGGLGCKSEPAADTGGEAPAKVADSGSGAGPAKAEPPAATGDGPGDPALTAAMAQHFVHASELERAVIDGELDGAKEHALALTEELPKLELPAAWQPHTDRMLAAARAAAASEDLAAVAAATGQVIAACGACHAALGAGPKFADVDAVPEGESTQARMARHQWAAQRMREGMLGPSEPRWQQGAAAVSVAPPEPCPIPDAEILAKEVLDLREAIYEIGAKAAKTEGLEAQAEVYGEYLSTCAGCHVGGC